MLSKRLDRQRRTEQLIQPEQSCRRVAAAAAEPGGQGNLLFQVDADAGVELLQGQKGFRRAIDEILPVHRQGRLIAGELNATAAALETDHRAAPPAA